ncbi:peptidyl-alpha-hydroxyglycine alpha-amidating lyase family protein [Chloroflexota bacterium]
MSYGSGKHTYELEEEWAKLPNGWSFISIAGVLVDSSDKVYILNRGDHPVIVLSREGDFITSWGEGYFGRAHAATYGNDGSIWCADDGNHTVTRFTPEGEVLQVLGERDQPSDTGYVEEQGISSIKRGGLPFNRPTGVALSPSGEIYVSDGYGNARVHKFNSDGKLLLSWGEPGTGLSQFRIPHGIWLDREQRVWICDRENDRIQIFSANGEFINQWTDLSVPTDLFIDNEGTVYVSEISGRVSIFTYDGKLIARWGSPEKDPLKSLFCACHTISVDSHGDLYVGEVSRNIERGPRVMRKFLRKT